MANVLDYGGRQSKHVSRRIFVDALRRLNAIEKVSKYAYVGFGAYQFLDFELVHRELGIVDMTSIESSEKLIPRCQFNAPYRGIKILEGTANTIIPALDWSKKSIVWLDYTQRLRNDEMADCENVALQLKPGSVLAVTLNCHAGEDGSRRDELAKAVGNQNVPIGVTDAKLGEWGLAKVQRELLTSLIHRTLANRGDGTSWQQILNIQYRDDARMQMLVGIIDHPEIHEKIQACRFEDMQEVSIDAEPLTIQLPSLTLRERQALDKKLPTRSALKEFAGIPAKDIAAYAQFYRWLDPVG
ncbi:O-methyltransferase [Rhodococcus aetherivorans]|uniref:O-methyltransferase n=1 Tax=Rhodococcus aetherivorans TaxID=191292 RepID=UPI0031E33F55